MSLMEVILLIVGFIAFVVSFFIPDRGESSDEEGFTRDEIREIVLEEYEASKSKLEDITDETVNYSIEKAERSLDKITNERMLALGEYSDTIMNQINTNHQETVFLHDMLNSNKNDLTTMLTQAMKDSKEALDSSNQAAENAKKAMEMSESAYENAKKASENAVLAEDKMIDARKAINGDEEKPARKTSTRKTTSKKTKTSAKKAEVADDIIMDNDGQISLNFDVSGENSSNNNDKILKLHSKGKSNVAIAKELGLGVGEVNLVIALFDKK